MNESANRRFEEIKAGGKLPSPRGIALAVLELSRRSNVSAQELTRLVQTDPAMTGRILRYANAAHGGALRHIATLSQAITFLGLLRIRQITLGFSLIDQYRKGQCKAFDYDRYWAVSLGTAIAARQLARIAQSPADETYTCGLLAGIGRLGLASAFPEQYGEIMARNLGRRELRTVERSEFGLDHAELSAEMLTAWGLPDIFTNAVLNYEDPAEVSFAPGSRTYALTQALNLASHFGELLVAEGAERRRQVPPVLAAATELGVAREEIPSLLDDARAAWHTWAADLHLATGDTGNIIPLLRDYASGGETPLSDELEGLVVAMAPTGDEEVVRLMALLASMGALAHVVDVSGTRNPDDAVPDVLMMSLEPSMPAARLSILALRKWAGERVPVIAIVQASAEPDVPALLAAGATDYLVAGATPPAVVARLHNARRMIALESALSIERGTVAAPPDNAGRANRRAMQDALTDPLTQLPNRRYGLERLAQEWRLAVENERPISCVLIDIDHLGKINTGLGSEAGDRILHQVGARVEACCRRSDLAFRYGGEEFLCICPGSGIEEARRLAERIVAGIAASPFIVSPKSIPVTVSAGVAARTMVMADPDDLILATDAALESAKKNGRNQVVAAVPEEAGAG